MQTLLKIAQKIKTSIYAFCIGKIYTAIFTLLMEHIVSSCIYAWINRYFADEQVTQAPNFNDPQKQDIRYLRNYLGDLADFQRICTDAEFAEKSQKLEDIKISFRQVLGTSKIRGGYFNRLTQILNV